MVTNYKRNDKYGYTYEDSVGGIGGCDRVSGQSEEDGGIYTKK